MENKAYNDLLNLQRRALSGTGIRLVHKQRARKLRRQQRQGRKIEASRPITVDGLTYCVWMPTE